MKNLFLSIFIFIGTIAIVAIVLEIVKSPKQAVAQYLRTRSVFQYKQGNTIFDAGTGYTIAPNLAVAFNNKEFNTTVHTNQLGFRDDDASLNNPDVLFLGDSYIWGWGVNENDGLEQQYEKITGKKVLNMGMPGYGNVQELLTLFKWERRGPLAGKQIFLFFCPNDLLDNENTSFGAFPYFKTADNSVTLYNPTTEGYNGWQDAVNKWGINNSIARQSILAYYVIAGLKNLGTKDIYKDYQTDDSRMNGAQAFMYVAENLAMMQKQNNCTITIVYIPPAAYYKTGSADISHRLVQDVCSKLQIGFEDLSPVLEASDYYPLDMHWKPSGHRKGAAYISAL